MNQWLRLDGILEVIDSRLSGSVSQSVSQPASQSVILSLSQWVHHLASQSHNEANR